jgi:hypothetical protein
LRSIEEATTEGKIFFRRRLAMVTITAVSTDTFDGYDLTDDDGHLWLRIGTDNMDDYYPCFTFDYYPKESAK